MPVYHVTLGGLAPDGAEAYDRYANAVLPLIEEFGGRVVARGPRIEILEGSELPEFLAVIAFPDAGRVRAMLDDTRYRAAVAYRRAAFREYRTMLVDPM